MTQDEQDAVREVFRSENVVADAKVLLKLVDAGEDFVRATKNLGRATAAYGRMYARWTRVSFSVYRSAARLLASGEPRAALRRCFGLDLFDSFEGLGEDVSLDDAAR